MTCCIKPVQSVAPTDSNPTMQNTTTHALATLTEPTLPKHATHCEGRSAAIPITLMAIISNARTRCNSAEGTKLSQIFFTICVWFPAPAYLMPMPRTVATFTNIALKSLRQRPNSHTNAP